MHEVGEILYIVSNKRRQIFPVRVVEQVIRKTLEGEAVTYRVQIPSAGDKVMSGSGVIDLASIDGTVHVTIDGARQFLYEQANRAIQQMLETAQEMAKEFEFHQTPRQEVLTQRPATIKNGISKVKVKLEDGTSATVTLPEVQ